MGIAIQKSIILLIANSIFVAAHLAHASTLKKCAEAPLTVSEKNVGKVQYAAEQCGKSWQNQSIELEFSYTENIPAWAFRRAANHFLKKNIASKTERDALMPINRHYSQVKNGDTYRLRYDHTSSSLRLFLNGQQIAHIKNQYANQYFKIWFGSAPFSDTLKRQLLNP
ncbi:chalcone isomerase family protein [Acinetobacter sp.]|uniref:chalcone isomerase family protein n=1 Tax=Acinetobacter sp. TaxID=472 RepID=UPI0035B4DEE4